MTVRMNPGPAGGLASTAVAQALFTLNGANMQLTTDQSMVKNFTGTYWLPVAITTIWASGAFNTGCAGGIYTAASKGGTAIVAAAQSYAALTGSGTTISLAIASAGPWGVTPILSLTTGNSAALTANFVVWGVVLG